MNAQNRCIAALVLLGCALGCGVKAPPVRDPEDRALPPAFEAAADAHALAQPASDQTASDQTASDDPEQKKR